MILIDAIMVLLAVVAGFYWLVAAVVAVMICLTRCAGSSASSAVPAVATLTGAGLFYILRSYFGVIDSRLWWAAILLPDCLWLCGEIVLWLRIRVLKLPDKARPSAGGG